MLRIRIFVFAHRHTLTRQIRVRFVEKYGKFLSLRKQQFAYLSMRVSHYT
jgi:hypothetical protein